MENKCYVSYDNDPSPCRQSSTRVTIAIHSSFESRSPPNRDEPGKRHHIILLHFILVLCEHSMCLKSRCRVLKKSHFLTVSDTEILQEISLVHSSHSTQNLKSDLLSRQARNHHRPIHIYWFIQSLDRFKSFKQILSKYSICNWY